MRSAACTVWDAVGGTLSAATLRAPCGHLVGTIHVHARTWVCLHVHTRGCKYMLTHAHTSLSVHVHARTWVCLHVHTRGCMHGVRGQRHAGRQAGHVCVTCPLNPCLERESEREIYRQTGRLTDSRFSNQTDRRTGTELELRTAVDQFVIGVTEGLLSGLVEV